MSPIEFFAKELAPSKRRIDEAARTAIKATMTAGLAAIAQTVGPFGPLFAFRIGQPGISLGLFEGAIAIGCAAIMQAAIVPITGKLLDYPGLLMAFVFLTFATIGYFLSNIKLFLVFALIAIATITTVYVGIFEPGSIGWGSTYTFDGILLATLVLVLIDTWLWPSPPEPRLIELLADDLERMRRRLEAVGEHYLNPLVAPLPAPEVTSMLARNLALWNAVKEHTKPTSAELAIILNTIFTCEHLYLEVERLAVLTEGLRSPELELSYHEELQWVFAALDRALAEKREQVLNYPNSSATLSQRTRGMQISIQRLSDASVLALQDSGGLPNLAPEAATFSEFISGLLEIDQLLHLPDRTAPLVSAEADAKTGSESLIDPAAFRFAVKLGTATTLGLLVGLTSQRYDIQTILWSVVVTGSPNEYGAVIRKTALRLVGCIVGGLAALASMIIVSQHFDSLPPYLIAIFVMIMASTYVAQSDEWLGYAGIQAGITFVICYVGLGPTSDIYRPLWRFWGIVLGVLTTGFVFLVIRPEYASDKVVGALAKLTRATRDFAKQVTEESTTEPDLWEAERRISGAVVEVFNLADQSRLEGRRGANNRAAAIEAVYLLIRIAYRFELIARVGGASAETGISYETSRRLNLEKAFCRALDIHIVRLEQESGESLATLVPIQPYHLDDELSAIQERYFTPASIASATLLNSYRRLSILLKDLDNSLSRIELPELTS